MLDTYLGFLDTSDNATDKVGALNSKVMWLGYSHPLSPSQELLPTPRIDTVLESYKQKASGTDCGSGGCTDYEGRLVLLEKQLTSLLHKTKVAIT